MFITLEGIDGAGKSSHIARIAHRIQGLGRELVSTREPGGSPLAEALREQILHAPMDALTESLLVFAARRDHLVTVIEPALARGAVVLSDRFTDATFAYQGYGRGFDLSVLTTLSAWVQQGREPDLTLWFDLDPAEAARRLSAARRPDRFEREPTAFFAAVAQGYAARAAAAPERVVRLDADLPPEQVAAQVDAVLAARGL
jgi:dTMP kinase